MGLFPQINVFGHINRRKPVFSCRVDDLPSVHRFAKEPTAQRATSKMGLFPQINVLGHIKSVVIRAGEGLFFGCRGCHLFLAVGVAYFNFSYVAGHLYFSSKFSLSYPRKRVSMQRLKKMRNLSIDDLSAWIPDSLHPFQGFRSRE
ncbi:MAG: hypothetical protein V3V99_10305 [candidate division Zixibacteria bacterium]